MPAIQPRHQTLADVWLVTNDSEAAYRAAGFKSTNPGTIRVTVSRTLARPEVKAYIAARQAAAAERTEIEVADVVRELGKCGFFNPAAVRRDGRFLPPEEWDEDSLAAIASMDIIQAGEETKVLKIKLASKTDALAKIGQHLGMFVQKHEHKIPGLADAVANVLDDIDGAGTGLPPPHAPTAGG